MIKLDFAKNKTYYVVGLGKSNRTAVKALQKSGADVRIWDDNNDNLAPFDTALICPPDKAPWSKIKAVIMTPGISPNHDIASMAREKNIDVICDIDLFAQTNPSSKIIGITGTNGKSTVTALINHILGTVALSQMGGNIGTPVLDLKSRVDYTILELSSYQLEYSPNLKCDIAVLLNITSDHLQWHETMDNYVAAKSKIFNRADIKIISIDDDHSKSIFDGHSDAIPLTIFNDTLPIQQNQFPRLKGDHNLQNMLAAYKACELLGISHDSIIDAIKTFEGLQHRQYLARVINGIPYINDSKATNAEATKMALKPYRNIIWIVGGRQKEGGISPLGDELKNVETAYLFGEAAQEFSKSLKSRGVETEIFETLDEALNAAHIQAQGMRGEPTGAPTVLFSPACASFDQYPNFEARGDHFVKLVENLPNDL